MKPLRERQDVDVRFNRRDFLRWSAMTVGGAALAACAAPVTAPTTSSATEGAAAPTQEQVTLRLQNWFSEGDLGAWKIGLDRLAEEHPEIAIKLEYNPYGETAVRIMAEAAAGNVPDLIMASNEHTPILACSQLLMDLNPFIEREPEVNPDDFAAGVSQGFKMWDRWWGFPYDQSTWAIYYNQAMFDEAGIDYPPGEGGEPWTMEEFIEVAKALTKPNGEQWGVWYPGGGGPNQYLDSCFIYSAGGRNFDDNLRTCIIDSPEAAQGLQYIVDLMHVHQVAPTPAELAGGNIDYFASGLAAMHLQGQWDLLGKNQTSDFDFDVGYLPLIDLKRGVTGGSGFCISASTAHPEEAWTWLKRFTSSEILGEMIGSTGRGIPARWSAAETYLKGAGKAEHAKVFIEQLEWAFNDRSVVAYYEFVDSYRRNLEPIYATGEGSIEEALAKIAEETNAAMDEKWASCTLEI
ncbi:MAG: sugar ABC transporter substrate-binding protein [Litorilinea sp.]|nr:MAG: sugar ABC transporter substrate-binding protein [Litorilinea sp.]